MNQNMIASVKEMLKGNPVKVSEVKAKLKVKTKVADFAEELKDAGFTIQKWERTWMVTAFTPRLRDSLKEINDALGISDDDVREEIRKLNETPTEPASAKGQPETRPLTEDEAELTDFTAIKDWRTAENIAESLNMPIKDVHDALYEALSEPGVKMRRCANDDTNFEYSAWPDIIDVVREFYKVREELTAIPDFKESWGEARAEKLYKVLRTVHCYAASRVSCITEKTGLKYVNVLLDTLRHYGLVTVILDASGGDPKYAATSLIESGITQNPIKPPLLDNGSPDWFKRWKLIHEKTRMFEHAVNFATIQDVRQSLGWAVIDFEATIKDFELRAIVKVFRDDHAIHVTRNEFADYAPWGKEFVDARDAAIQKILAVLANGPCIYEVLKAAVGDVHFTVLDSAYFHVLEDGLVKEHNRIYTLAKKKHVLPVNGPA